jgi:glutamate decarboxylase
VFHVSYLGGDSPTFNLNFSRPAGQVIGQYYEFLRLGRDGYGRVQSRLYEAAATIASAVAASGRFEVIHDGDPDAGLAAVCWRLKAETRWNLYDLADRMRTHGWLVPAYTLPANLSDVVIQRVVIRHGMSGQLTERFVADFTSALATLDSHPPTVSLTDVEAGTSSHTGKPSHR